MNKLVFSRVSRASTLAALAALAATQANAAVDITAAVAEVTGVGTSMATVLGAVLLMALAIWAFKKIIAYFNK